MNLRFAFRIGTKYSRDVDDWVKFASEKDVRSFELDLEKQVDRDRNLSGRGYNFPSTERLFSSSNIFSSLTSLSLRYVDVDGKVLEHFLANCLFLKELRVIRSSTLVKLNVTGLSLKLELLEVSDCYYMRVLSISAKNLVSLKYDGLSQPLVLKNVPSLSRMSIAGDILSSLKNKSCRHFGSIRKLESLEVKMEWKECSIPKFRPQFPQMHRLKQLELDIEYTFGNDLMFYASLIKAFPSLLRLAMRYKYKYSLLSDEEGEEPSDHDKRLEKGDKMTTVVSGEFKHKSLKVVELAGFDGCETDVELVSRLVAVAYSLEKLIIQPGEWHRDASRRHARQLQSKLPSTLKLFILSSFQLTKPNLFFDSMNDARSIYIIYLFIFTFRETCLSLIYFLPIKTGLPIFTALPEPP